ncbi:MAG: YdeI/OmpD-associated family protein [Caldilinea sp.]|nr:YdeI/OmpD-associated family protein [Caldilinea sp.]MCB0065982.1 YdeI/OmpD-associated family protein [Caldilineaceae bacterium]MCB0039431.1 YdeI/OmpD-associated family protein [Caldilinea sp.]MCB0050234.1 YdeI/OmpD-associated family protein [Caldilinea sp.]MCB0151036.1 YdeI/OmpD-associated family protein [Caldilineaceae bacterium]
MQEQARGPLALGDDVIRAETGRDSESWYIMLDAGGARQLSHGQIVELLAGVYGLEDRWAGIMAVRYEAARAIDRAVAVPADLVAAMLFKSAARVRFEQLPQAEQRSLIFWLDEASDGSERRARIGELIERLQQERGG